MKISRRQAVTALGLGLCGLSAPIQLGCSDSSARPVERRSIEKTLHIACKGRERLIALASYFELRAGVQRIQSRVHSEETRRVAISQTSPDQRPLVEGSTHFFENVALSIGAPQSIGVFAIFADGHELLYAAAIHVPVEADRARLASDSYDPDDPDPHHFIDEEQCAIWAVFNTPSMMSHDSDTALTVVDEIRKAPSFGALATAIGVFPTVVDPSGTPPSPDAKPIEAGWVYGAYRYYTIGDQPPVPVIGVRLDGSEILDANGKPQVAIDWLLSDAVVRNVLPVSVRALANYVMREVTAAFNDQRDKYEEVKYFTYAGVSQSDASSALATGVKAEGKDFLFSAAGVTNHHRQLSVEEKDEGFEIKFVNYLALGSLFGVSHFDDKGRVLKTNLLGYVPATYYPSLTHLFGPSSAEGKYQPPPETFTSNVWTAALGVSHGDNGPDGEQVNLTSRALVTWVLSAMTDFLLPGTFLALGLAGARHARDQLVKAVLEEAGEEGGLEGAYEILGGLAGAIYNVGAGQNVGKMLRDFGKDILKVVLRLTEKIILQGRFAKICATVFAEAGAETSIALATPLIGWAVYAADVATTGVQLGFATDHLLTNDVFTHGVVHYTHTVSVTLTPKDSTYFPSGIGFYRATVATADGSSAFLPVQSVGRFVPKPNASGIEAFELEIGDVPILVAFSLQVDLFDRDPTTNDRPVVRGTLRVATIANVTERGEAQHVAYAIDTPPLPIDGSTQLVHDVLLRPTAGGFAWSAGGAPAPAGDADPYACKPGALCEVSGLYVRQNATQAGRIAFDFSTSTSNGSCPIMAGVAMPASRAAQPTSTTVNANEPKALGARRLVTSLDGTSVVLSQTTTERVRVYLVPRSDADFSAEKWQENGADLYVTSRGNRVSGARLSPSGTCLFLALADAVEIIPITRDAGSASSRQPTSPIVRPGQEAGCLSLPVAVAGFHDRAQVAVLDAGLGRVTVFDYAGNFVPWFRGDLGYLALNSGTANRIYLDLDVDPAGDVWVLARAQDFSRYYLDVYGKTGALLASFGKLQADRFALDRFNQVFTLNRQVLPGPNGYPVPTVSRWYPQNS